MKITSRGQVLLVHLQMTFLSVYFPSLFQTFTDFLLWNTKEDILKNVGNQNGFVFHWLNMTKKILWRSMGPKMVWFRISEYLVLCSTEDRNIRQFYFVVDYSFNNKSWFLSYFKLQLDQYEHISTQTNLFLSSSGLFMYECGLLFKLLSISCPLLIKIRPGLKFLWAISMLWCRGWTIWSMTCWRHLHELIQRVHIYMLTYQKCISDVSWPVKHTLTIPLTMACIDGLM